MTHCLRFQRRAPSQVSSSEQRRDCAAIASELTCMGMQGTPVHPRTANTAHARVYTVVRLCEQGLTHLKTDR